MSAAAFIDDLAIAPLSAIEGRSHEFGQIFGNQVGAIVEYEYFRRHARTQLPAWAEKSGSPIASRIVHLLDAVATNGVNLSLQPIDADVIAIPTDLGREPSWTAFLKRAETTARRAGFGESVAAGLAGAMHELADNVIQHSEAINSGIVAFAQAPAGFEYVIADSGIGMLTSLRRAAELHSLRDDLEALPLAVTPGVSRRGRGIGYGYGYRAVFLPLRAAHGTVRLRSGEAVLEITGDGPSPDQGKCSQRPFHKGVVVSVSISPKTMRAS